MKSENFLSKNSHKATMIDLYDALTLAEEISDGFVFTSHGVKKAVKQIEQDDASDNANQAIRSAVNCFKAILNNPHNDIATAEAATAKQLLEQAIELRKDQMPIPNLTATNG